MRLVNIETLGKGRQSLVGRIAQGALGTNGKQVWVNGAVCLGCGFLQLWDEATGVAT